MAFRQASTLKILLSPWVGLELSSLASIELLGNLCARRAVEDRLIFDFPGPGMRQALADRSRFLMWVNGCCWQNGWLVAFHWDSPGLAGPIAGTTPAPRKRKALAGQEIQTAAAF